MRNQRGFGFVALLGLLPLLITLLWGAGVFGRQLLQWGELHHTCRVEVLHHQNRLRSTLIQLTSLNPRARKLLTQKRAAQAALVAALATGQPALIKSTQSHLQRIIGQQILLDGQQRLIILMAHAESRRFFLRLRQNKKLTAVQFLHQSALDTYPLAVRARPAATLAPEYLPADQFSDKQALGVTAPWSPLGVNAPADKNFWRIECGATLKKEGKKWFTHLKKVKVS